MEKLREYTYCGMDWGTRQSMLLIHFMDGEYEGARDELTGFRLVRLLND